MSHELIIKCGSRSATQSSLTKDSCGQIRGISFPTFRRMVVMIVYCISFVGIIIFKMTNSPVTLISVSESNGWLCPADNQQMECRYLNRLAPIARSAFLQQGESQRVDWDLSRKPEYRLWLLLASVDHCQIKHTSTLSNGRTYLSNFLIFTLL